MRKLIITASLLACATSANATSFDMRLTCEIYGDVAVRMMIDKPSIQLGKAFYGDNSQARVIMNDGEETTVLMASDSAKKTKSPDMAMIAYTEKSLQANSIRLVIPHVGKDVCSVKTYRDIDM